MTIEAEVLKAERGFFAGLIHGSAEELRSLLTDDFILIDVMTGSELPGSELLRAVGAGQLKFLAIEAVESRVRVHGKTAIVTGRTRMQGRFGEQSFAAHSRYTHVFVEEGGAWRLASAQGTQVAPS
jgi:ketosteroid isomerase-like protein